MAESDLESELRAVLERDDDYRTAGKPSCDWDDAAAREELVDALARDAHAVLAHLEDRQLTAAVSEALQLVATVVGQDLERLDDGAFRIARRVAKDRIISTVDPEARHGHKTSARGFDGYKGHISIDPDSEIIVATDVTAGNVADGNVAVQLLDEVLRPAADADRDPAACADESSSVEIYGDSSYGTAEVVDHIEEAGAEANVKVQPPSGAKGKFRKDDFQIDDDAGTVTCPAGRLVPIRRSKDGGGLASFAPHCDDCPLRSQCTDSKAGRHIKVHPREKTLQRSRQRQGEPAWRQRYRSTRPKVERKLSHMMFRRHGGRRARVRGRSRVAHDFALLAAAVNLKRLAVLGVGAASTPRG